jgi:tRNA(Ile)-lysidine synthase
MKVPLVFEKFIRAIKNHALLDRGDRVVVAVSGGADSVALLSLLLEVRTQFELDLIVAHLNHNLRGTASDEDEEFVRVLAHRLGTRFISEKIPAEDVKARLGGLENWAREQRYAFLLRAAGSVHSQKVALGHTMNDQAETFLMRLFRGSGSVGLSAMSFRREMFIRPLLSIQRKEILEYLKLRGIQWREDASNLDTQYLRNRLRQELIPSFQDRYNPKIVPQLAATADILREESEALRFWAAEVFDREAIIEGNSVCWNVENLVSLPSGLQKRLIRLSFERMAPGGHSPSARNVASIIELLSDGKSGTSLQTGLLQCFRDFNRLRLEAVPPSAPQTFCYALRIPGRIDLPQTGTYFEARHEPSPPSSVVLNRWELFLSREELEAGFYIRNWEPADVYFAPGANSPKRVAEMFAEKKIPLRCRTSWPVVVLAGKVVCIRDFPVSSSGIIRTPEQALVVVEERSQGK